MSETSPNFDLNSKISPSILLIIIILSIIFFISGLLHLLVRFLLTPTNQNREDYFNNVTALQGQLQQLFHLHDSGVDQSFIDTLPIFHYKSIIGLKNYPFDCAVCLCEFETEDKLRLLPKCSHAFHMECIDTWLLSHSTCPLCRSSLLSDLSSHQVPRPSFLLVLESASDHSSREIVEDRDNVANDVSHTKNPKPEWIVPKPEQIPECSPLVVPFEVKLGKFRNIDMGEGSSDVNNIGDSSKLDERRCFSMGSYEYIMDDETTLKVHVSTKKLESKNHRLPGHRTAMSECSFDPIGRTNQRVCPLDAKIGCEEDNQKRDNLESLEAKTPSFARRTMLWLAGRQNKVAHSSSTSNV